MSKGGLGCGGKRKKDERPVKKRFRWLGALVDGAEDGGGSSGRLWRWW